MTRSSSGLPKKNREQKGEQMRPLNFRSAKNIAIKLAAQGSMLLPLLLSCQAREAQAVLRKNPIIEEARKKPERRYESSQPHQTEKHGGGIDEQTTARGTLSYKHPEVDVSCSYDEGVLRYKTSDGKERTKNGILQSGERAWDIKCDDSYVHIMTDRNLLTVQAEPSRIRADKLAITKIKKWVEMDDVFAQGLVDWTHSSEDIFFLTRAGKVSVLPIINDKKKLVWYKFENDFSRSRIVYHSGFVFIAPASNELICMDRTGRFVRFPDVGEGEFRYKKHKLYYRTEKKETEILTPTADVADIRIF